MGQRPGDGIQIANGVYWQVKSLYNACSNDDSHQRGGNFLQCLGPEDQNGQGQTAHAQGGNVHRPDAQDHLLQLLHGLHGSGLEGQAHKVLDLADQNGHGDAGGEAGGDGIGDVLDHAAHAQQAHDDEQDARQNGGHRQAVHAVAGHDTRHDGGEGRRGPGDLHLAPAQGGDQKSGHDGGVQSLLRGHAGGQGQGDGQGQGNDRHDDAGYQVFDERFFGIVSQRQQQLRFQFTHGSLSSYFSRDTHDFPL